MVDGLSYPQWDLLERLANPVSENPGRRYNLHEVYPGETNTARSLIRRRLIETWTNVSGPFPGGLVTPGCLIAIMQEGRERLAAYLGEKPEETRA